MIIALKWVIICKITCSTCFCLTFLLLLFCLSTISAHRPVLQINSCGNSCNLSCWRLLWLWPTGNNFRLSHWDCHPVTGLSFLCKRNSESMFGAVRCDGPQFSNYCPHDNSYLKTWEGNKESRKQISFGLFNKIKSVLMSQRRGFGWAQHRPDHLSVPVILVRLWPLCLSPIQYFSWWSSFHSSTLLLFQI